jgi:maltodextrin utilization protein YvdJ
MSLLLTPLSMDFYRKSYHQLSKEILLFAAATPMPSNVIQELRDASLISDKLSGSLVLFLGNSRGNPQPQNSGALAASGHSILIFSVAWSTTGS